MSFYGWVLLFSIVGPIALSFDKKVHFYTYWKSILYCFFFISIPFILFDDFYTANSIWGFTKKYVSDIYFDFLPLEEVLFFFLIPYCCLFVHEVMKFYFPKIATDFYGKFFALSLFLTGFYFGLKNLDHWYTAAACLLSSLLIAGFCFFKKRSWWNQFAISFTVVAIPFLIVNGVLTGAITEDPIVWYNPNHIMNIRIYTVPIEDIYYNLCMLLPMVAIHEGILKKKNSNFMR